MQGTCHLCGTKNVVLQEKYLEDRVKYVMCLDERQKSLYSHFLMPQTSNKKSSK